MRPEIKESDRRLSGPVNMPPKNILFVQVTINTTPICVVSKFGTWVLALCALDMGEPEQRGSGDN